VTRLGFDEYWRRIGLRPDRFQLEACRVIAGGDNVLVSAPTGSGKTAIAGFAVTRALEDGRRAIYTTPIKALSNQKFVELVAFHGAERVGLLTGDVSERPDADVVVMTTEVLRNMIYSDSARLDSVEVVVLDEVHFIQDAYRGAVWEEVIIHLPPAIRLVALSATVSNATRVAEWMTSVRGATMSVEERTRSVTLTHLYALDAPGEAEPTIVELLRDGRPNPDVARAERRMQPWRGGRAPRGKRRTGPRPPGRTELVEALARRDMLPAIFFIFSRTGCSQAAAAAIRHGLDMTTDGEKREIIAFAESVVDDYSDDDLAVLGFGRFLGQLERGVGVHHAGLVPAFKQIVENLFGRGLVKVVFATETLAVGINMPARSVVLDKLTKFEGTSHRILKASEYAQLTGRAGRRGLDESGYAVITWSPFVTSSQVAGLVSSRSFDLHSSFRPTYNMVANLVRRVSRTEATRLLSLTFAEFERRGRREDRSLLDDFSDTRSLLERRGFLEGWNLTPAGATLCGIFHENDVCVAESLDRRALDGLGAVELAALCSVFVHDPRRDEEEPTRAPRRGLQDPLDLVRRVHDEIAADERRLGLPPRRRPHAGAMASIAEWASGGSLEDVLAEDGPSAGDFVRSTKQLVDLLRQVGPFLDPSGRSAAFEAVERIDRGVVALSHRVGHS